MELMKSLNFAEVYDMLGGIVAWEEAGLPLINPTIQTTTAGELAASGGTLYNKTCTYPDCHSKFGEGGEDEFTAANLSPFSNAERVFNLVSSIMHLNIGDYEEDAPSQDDYLQILAYIMVQNGIVQPGDAFGRSDLLNVAIK